jgi:hypothetical protein
MIRYRIVAPVALVAALLAGCSVRSDLMTATGESSGGLRPAPGKALVVFLRPEYVGYAIQAVVYDDVQFIGVVSRHSAVAYQAEPGTHRFMVVSEAADFMDADLARGRTYFVQVRPRMGAWRARFSLAPLSATADARDIAAWLAESRVASANDRGRRWAEENRSSVLHKKAAYEPKWLEKADRPVLHRDDGSAPID